MTSRLTLSALLFSILSTGALVGSAEASAPAHPVAVTRTVVLERVSITAPRLAADA